MFGCQPTNLYQYGFAKSKMVGAIVFFVFSFFIYFLYIFLYFCFSFFFFNVEPCGRNKTLTKSIKLNFLAKLKAKNQRVDLNLKTSGTIFDYCL